MFRAGLPGICRTRFDLNTMHNPPALAGTGLPPVGQPLAFRGRVSPSLTNPWSARRQDPIEVHWREVVFGLCGVTNGIRRSFSPVLISTPAQRAAWLAEAETHPA